MEQKMACPVKIKMRLQALALCSILGLPSVIVTISLFVIPPSDPEDTLDNNVTSGPLEEELQLHQQQPEEPVVYQCYENFTVYYAKFETARFWIEGVLLISVGTLGILGNILTLAVLGKSKKTNFNQLLVVLSVLDTILIAVFITMSACLVVQGEVHNEWFNLLFPYLLWPLGNLAITGSVLMVVAVSTERYLAICRPMQYKPGRCFYLGLVLAISLAVNVGRFLEFQTSQTVAANVSRTSIDPTPFMGDERYVMFSRYWTEIIVIGVLPLIALVALNYGIYVKIRKSVKFRNTNEQNAGKRGTGSMSTTNGSLPTQIVTLQACFFCACTSMFFIHHVMMK